MGNNGFPLLRSNRKTCPDFDGLERDPVNARLVARRIVDRNILHLIKLWLKVPVEERDEKGKRQMTGGRKSRCGSPRRKCQPDAREPAVQFVTRQTAPR
jgi:hypothetical protein